MAIYVTCEGCNKSFKTRDEHAGRTAKCAICGTSIKIPGPSESSLKQDSSNGPVSVGLPPSESSSNPPTSARTLPSIPTPTPIVERVRLSFEGEFPRVTPTIGYRLASLVVAVVMIILPLIYVAMIFAIGCALLWHASTNLILVIEMRGGLQAILLLYFTPLIAGGMMILLMIKPLFARRVQSQTEVELAAVDEPLIHSFVQQLCTAVNAPRPCLIEVNCDVNASVYFKKGWRGFLRRDLVLQIGLPLLSAMNTRQLAGVLAHELGHFSQSAGMQLNYVIRTVNDWFLEVVYQRDTWDEWLASWCKEDYASIAILAVITRFVLWLTRRILWVLMTFGHFVSCVLSRQMEFDADKYKARLAGSEVFESSMRMMTQLGFANLIVQQVLAANYERSGLPDDMPECLSDIARKLPPEFASLVETIIAGQKTNWFDSHPASRDRIVAAHRENAAGIYREERPAILLVTDFSKLAKQSTLAYYQRIFNDPTADLKLQSTSSYLAEIEKKSEEIGSSSAGSEDGSALGSEGSEASAFTAPTSVDSGIASSASNPGLVVLSHAKLRNLRPDLYGIGGWLHSIVELAGLRWPVKRTIENQLLTGDSRAAVVLSTSPLLVAAYTDEFDCVAVLQFPDRLVEPYQLHEGSRLLTVNFYGRSSKFDEDLIIGPNCSSQFNGFHPIIAEFVTDDLARVEARKKEIDEAEWQRTLLLGHEYLQLLPNVARDGRPGYAATPVPKQS